MFDLITGKARHLPSHATLPIVLSTTAQAVAVTAVLVVPALFVADRMVKSLGSGVAVIEQTISQQVVDRGVDIELAMLCLQNYRTEGGRGGT